MDTDDIDLNIDEGDEPSQPKVYSLADLDDKDREELLASLFQANIEQDGNEDFNIYDHLFMATLEGNIKSIQVLNKYFPDIVLNELPDYGNSPIEFILNLDPVEQKDVNTLLKLMELGADNYSTNGRNMTPLMFVLKHGRLEDVTKFIDHYARLKIEGNEYNINARDSSGLTALYYAAERNSADIVNMLLAQGADPGLANYSGQTPLCFAADRGYAAVVESLLNPPAFLIKNNEVIINEYHNYINAQNPNQALLLASESEQKDVIAIFEKHNIVLSDEVSQEIQINLIITAIDEGDYNKAKKMFEHGINLDLLSEHDYASINLALAILKDDPALTQTIASSQTTQSVAEDFLAREIFRGNNLLADKLINAGVSLSNVLQKYPVSIAHAARHGLTAIIDSLPIHSINQSLTAKDKMGLSLTDNSLVIDNITIEIDKYDGITPLALAVYYGHAEMVEKLVQKGSKTDVLLTHFAKQQGKPDLSPDLYLSDLTNDMRIKELLMPKRKAGASAEQQEMLKKATTFLYQKSRVMQDIAEHTPTTPDDRRRSVFRK